MARGRKKKEINEIVTKEIKEKETEIKTKIISDVKEEILFSIKALTPNAVFREKPLIIDSVICGKLKQNTTYEVLSEIDFISVKMYRTKLGYVIADDNIKII